MHTNTWHGCPNTTKTQVEDVVAMEMLELQNDGASKEDFPALVLILYDQSTSWELNNLCWKGHFQSGFTLFFWATDTNLRTMKTPETSNNTYTVVGAIWLAGC